MPRFFLRNRSNNVTATRSRFTIDARSRGGFLFAPEVWIRGTARCEWRGEEDVAAIRESQKARMNEAIAGQGSKASSPIPGFAVFTRAASKKKDEDAERRETQTQ
jgi:hypothetical protein